jgi:hypothetical protein
MAPEPKAKASEPKAKASESKAKASESKAKASEPKAKASEPKAKASGPEFESFTASLYALYGVITEKRKESTPHIVVGGVSTASVRPRGRKSAYTNDTPFSMGSSYYG